MCPFFCTAPAAVLVGERFDFDRIVGVACVRTGQDHRSFPAFPFLLEARELSDDVCAVALADGCGELARRGRFIVGAAHRGGDNGKRLTDANFALEERQSCGLQRPFDSGAANRVGL